VCKYRDILVQSSSEGWVTEVSFSRERGWIGEFSRCLLCSIWIQMSERISIVSSNLSERYGRYNQSVLCKIRPSSH
jgi:hypothetical protein